MNVDSRPRISVATVLAAAVVILAACGELPPPSPRPPSPVAVAPSSAPPAITTPTPRAVIGTIPPLDCEVRAHSIIDYADHLTGVPDIVTATLEVTEVEHLPDDQIVVEGDRTAILRDGGTFYVFEWFSQTAEGGCSAGPKPALTRATDRPSRPIGC